MAEWKKVVVSGSNISQLNNDAGYLVAAGLPNTFATMSINGVSVIADSTTDTLTFASSSGAGLAIVGDAGADSITFTLGAIPNASLANSTISGVALGSTLNALTAGSGLNNGGGTYTGAATRTFSVDSGSMLPYYSSSIFATVSGDITITSAGVAAIGTGVIVNADVAAGAAIAASKINFATTGIVSGSTLAAGSGQGSTTLTTNGVSSGDVTATGLGTAGTPTFAGLTITNGNIAINNGTSTALTTTGTTAAVFNTTATTVNAFGAATTLNLGAATGTTSVQNNLNVAGNLFVQGTTTQINTTDLLVEDKFIVLASGSIDGSADAGIIIDRGSDTDGNIAFGFDSLTDRWGYQNGLTDTSTAIVIGTNGNSAFAGYVFTEAAHTSTKPITGEFVQAGAIYANTDGTLWMYA
jgi:hypothetical protein